MTTLVFISVLSAALLHAVWNAVLKGGGDKVVGMAGVVVGHAFLAFPVLLFFPFPAEESWPYIGLSALLHVGYQLFLMNAYRIGDLTQVYPIARGTAPLLVAGFSVVVLGVELLPLQILAVLVIACGIMSLSFVRRADGLFNRNAAMLAFVTGCFIASYSINDGLGARIAGSSLSFYACSAMLNAVIFVVILLAWRPAVLGRMTGEGWKSFYFGGPVSFIAYAIVTWAFTQAPIALVTALRETSIVFALLIGTVFLNERLNLGKVISTMATLLGAVLLRLAR